MGLAYFRFYEELNDFLPSEIRKKQFPYEFKGNPSVKDIIEAIGVPHPEIDMILVNSIPVGFSYKIKNEDYISVYPVFESLDISSLTHLRELPLRDIKFITDVHLGKLTKQLRLCGFDTFTRTDLRDEEIIDLALSDKRVILTRDKQLLKNNKVTHGYWIRSIKPYEQLTEVLIRFDLRKRVGLFTRCMECNGEVRKIAKSDILQRLQPGTIQHYRKFMECPDCKRIYWNGSHYQNMLKKLKIIFQQLK